MAGADALGLVFYGKSKRAVSIEQASEIVHGLPCFVSVVGLFVDADEALVKEACAALPRYVLQFHGEEPQDYCRQFSRPWMKALRVQASSDVEAEMQRYPEASAILLDTWRADSPGGTGERFDWSLVPAHRQQALVLAGGLNEHNVGAAISATRPFAVDISGGGESSPGVKDVQKLTAFTRAVARADGIEEMSNE